MRSTFLIGNRHPNASNSIHPLSCAQIIKKHYIVCKCIVSSYIHVFFHEKPIPTSPEAKPSPRRSTCLIGNRHPNPSNAIHRLSRVQRIKKHYIVCKCIVSSYIHVFFHEKPIPTSPGAKTEGQGQLAPPA